MNNRSMTIAMVAGEASGDNLGAALVQQIKALAPETRFVGIGGPAMIREGFTSDAEIERLSVNGFVDPLMRLPDLIRLLRMVRDRVIESGADCFVGVDFNFFNILLAGMLRKRGVKTIHYVSPTVWAWRQGRIKKIKRNVSLMLTLYPFETEIYEKNAVPVRFVGHPKADEIAPGDGERLKPAARAALGIEDSETVIAVLPGSRGSEVSMTGHDFLSAALLLGSKVDRFVIPAANEKRLGQIEEMLIQFPGLGERVQLVNGQSREVMTAADVVLVNSGTATLEAMLLRKPMVMSYRLGKMTYAVVSRLIKTQYFALPNILAKKPLVPELIQDDADPQQLADAVTRLLDGTETSDLYAEFDAIHESLRRSSAPGRAAALAVLEHCGVDI